MDDTLRWWTDHVPSATRKWFDSIPHQTRRRIADLIDQLREAADELPAYVRPDNQPEIGSKLGTLMSAVTILYGVRRDDTACAEELEDAAIAAAKCAEWLGDLPGFLRDVYGRMDS